MSGGRRGHHGRRGVRGRRWGHCGGPTGSCRGRGPQTSPSGRNIPQQSVSTWRDTHLRTRLRRTSASKGKRHITGEDGGIQSLTGRGFWRGVSGGLRRYRKGDIGLCHGACVSGACRRGSGGCIPRKKRQKSDQTQNQNRHDCTSLACFPQTAMRKRKEKKHIQNQKFRNINKPNWIFYSNLVMRCLIVTFGRSVQSRQFTFFETTVIPRHSAPLVAVTT